LNIRLAEVVAFEEQWFAQGLHQRISKAVSQIQFRWMLPLAVFEIRLTPDSL
jgi:hypothetical protein